MGSSLFLVPFVRILLLALRESWNGRKKFNFKNRTHLGGQAL
jgi:hypothetical protein